MGNAQSAEASRRTRASQKLSKPKTGNPATAGLLSPASFSSSARRLSTAQLPNPPAVPSTVTSTPTASSAAEGSAGLDHRRVNSRTSLDSPGVLPRESKRRSLFRSLSSRADTDLPQENQGTGSGQWIVDRLTRTSSLTYESAIAHYGQPGPESWTPGSRTSWNYNLSSYEAKRLLNFTEEAGFDQGATMSEHKMTVITESTWKSSNPAQQPPSAPITRANSDLSLYMPVRRRSIIQTPGVATRSNSTRDLPPLPPINVRYSHPPTPRSLSRQQSIESYRSGVISMPPRVQDSELLPRVLTPSEDRYLSIGAFKLGSLRITNGSPSPVALEAERDRRNEGLSAGEEIAQGGYFSRAHTRQTASTAVAAPARLDAVQPPMFLSAISQSPPSSPVQPDPSSPALQTTSKQTAMEDHLFDDEAQPEYSSVEVLDVRLDPNAKPPQTQLDRDTESSITRTDSGFVSATSPSSEVAHIPHKPLAKADSGYSSNVSLRSFQTKPHSPDRKTAPSSLEQDLPPSSLHDMVRAGLKIDGRSETEESYPEMPERESLPPPVPPKDPARGQPRPGSVIARKSIPSGSRVAGVNGRHGQRTTRPVPNPVLSIPANDKGPRSPESMLQSPRSTRSSTSDNSSSATSMAGNSARPGRFQRLLSGARRSVVGPPTIQVTNTPERNSIPPVPQEVEHKLQEHTSRFPSTARRLALRPRASLDTLKTIFSVGSLEASLDAVTSLQTAPAAAETESKGSVWKQTLNSVAHVIPRKPISRKPVPTRQNLAKEGSEGNETGLEEDARGAALMSPAESTASSRSRYARGRTMSLTFLAERGNKLRRPASDLNLARSATDLPSPALPSPVAKAMSAESRPRTSRSMSATRRPQSLRVPPPLRPQSSTASLSRKSSRESIQSHAAMQTFPSRTSIDSTQSYTSSQPGVGNGLASTRSPSGLPMDPRRLQSFRQYHSPQSPLHNSPNWDVQTDHGMPSRSSQGYTAGDSRRNSISSVQSEGVYRRPTSTQEWQFRAAQPQLRHRASYDGFSHQQQQQRRFAQRGYPPSMSNGYTAPVKPTPPGGYGPRPLDAATTWSRSQVDAAAGQWYQDAQRSTPVPYVPRGAGHYRNRSTGNWSGYGGPNPPYRVLHSYNSPAYRNAPIWG